MNFTFLFKVIGSGFYDETNPDLAHAKDDNIIRAFLKQENDGAILV